MGSNDINGFCLGRGKKCKEKLSKIECVIEASKLFFFSLRWVLKHQSFRLIIHLLLWFGHSEEQKNECGKKFISLEKILRFFECNKVIFIGLQLH